ncbi:uncharacterized protein [Dendropsophus ebraccatus]|uniref:uncharacterized protein n=1 Tax=Dendropsophus ebraccatus TaxID=150705 RepID=UPI003830FE1F
MRVILLLVFLRLMHLSTESHIPGIQDVSSWLYTIQSDERPMEKPPPPPPTMYEEFLHWIDTILSYFYPTTNQRPWKYEDFQSEDVVPHIRITYQLFGEFLADPVGDLYAAPGHRRTRERCIGVNTSDSLYYTFYVNCYILCVYFSILQNNPSPSIAPRENPTLMRRIYKWISSKVLGETPPPVTPREDAPSCMTLRNWVISGAVLTLLISPLFAAVVLAAWLAHEEEYSEWETGADSDAAQVQLSEDTVEAEPQPDTPATSEQNTESLNVPADPSAAPEPSRLKGILRSAPRQQVTLKKVKFNKKVHFRPIPPHHKNQKARSSSAHREREFVQDPMSEYDLLPQQDTVNVHQTPPAHHIARHILRSLSCLWCGARTGED